MISGRKLNVQQNADGKWQAELDPGQWHTCHSQSDADLLAGAAPLMLAWFKSG